MKKEFIPYDEALILKELGFDTLRFTDEEVKNNITNVERAIVLWIEENKK